MLITILTEGSIDWGIGHICRCLAFYDAFLNEGFDVRFIIHGDTSVTSLLSNRNVEYIPWLEDIALLKNCIKDEVVFMDSIQADQSMVDFLQNHVYKLIVIDDYRRRYYRDSIIIDWTPNVENSHRHKWNSSNLYLLGLQYSVLRNAFNLKSFYTVKPSVTSLFIIMGGTDVRGLTIPIVSSLLNSYSTLQYNIVIGSRTHVDLSLLNNRNIRFFYSLDAEHMKTLMLESDVAISAGGQTLYELASVGLPTIAIQVVDNQSEDISGFLKKGTLSNAFQWDDPYLFEHLIQELRKLFSFERRKFISDTSLSLSVGEGMISIVQVIKENLGLC